MAHVQAYLGLSSEPNEPADGRYVSFINLGWKASWASGPGKETSALDTRCFPRVSSAFPRLCHCVADVQLKGPRAHA